MRRFFFGFLLSLLVPAVCAPAQVIGVQPTPMGMYGWNGSTNQFNKNSNSYALFPQANTPEPFAFYGWNSSLNQWTPCDTVTLSCPLQGLGLKVTMRWSCQPNFGDGVAALTANTYPQWECLNDTGATVTLTQIKCIADAGASTMNVIDSLGNSLLNSAITCGTSYTAGTQTTTVTIANGTFLKFSLVLDGTTKQMALDVAGTY